MREENNGRLTDDDEEMVSPLGRRTDGPMLGRRLERTDLSSSLQSITLISKLQDKDNA